MSGSYNWDQVMARAPDGVTVSAIIVSYQTGGVLFDCLHALLADPDIGDVVVVDNGNPPDVLERLEALWRRHDERLRIVGDGQNRGFGAGVNLGAGYARGERLLILNPDAVLRRGSIAALEAAHTLGSEPVVVGGRIYGARGEEQRGGRRRRLTLASAAGTFLGLSRAPVLGRHFPDINRCGEAAPSGPVAMEAVSGALLYMSRKGFDWLKGFDEDYFLHVEDLDLCRRAEAEGGSVIYTPLAGAFHHGATSDAPSVVVERHKGEGLRRYFSKFARTPAEKLLSGLLGPAMATALVMRARWRARERD